MTPDQRFVNLPKSFWACVKTLSQKVGYAKKGSILTPSVKTMAEAFSDLNLDTTSLLKDGQATPLGQNLEEYFQYRSKVLHEIVEPNLMDLDRAKAEFYRLKEELAPTCPLPMNKQSGNKKDHNFLTGIVNMVIADALGKEECNFDPRELTTVTINNVPSRTLSRRVDGAFPGPVNPIAIWEIKEYYYTTTFGSRIADGVYETLLDGLELEELKDSEGVDVEHYLMVDAYDTWWKDGKSYLCRMVDMVNMKYVDEVLFGYESITELPRICSGWLSKAQNRMVQ
jgi:hypothetical protein